MTQLVTKIWNYEDYLNLPDDGNLYEIIEGELYVSPAPNTDHQHTSGELHFFLKEFVRRNQLGELYYAPYEVHLSEDTRPVQPDLLFIRTENAPKGGTPYFVGIPDLVVEILSKSSIRTDTNTKFNAYEKAGIPEYWIVDPKARTIRVLYGKTGFTESGGNIAEMK